MSVGDMVGSYLNLGFVSEYELAKWVPKWMDFGLGDFTGGPYFGAYRLSSFNPGEKNPPTSCETGGGRYGDICPPAKGLNDL